MSSGAGWPHSLVNTKDSKSRDHEQDAGSAGRAHRSQPEDRRGGRQPPGGRRRSRRLQDAADDAMPSAKRPALCRQASERLRHHRDPGRLGQRGRSEDLSQARRCGRALAARHRIDLVGTRPGRRADRKHKRLRGNSRKATSTPAPSRSCRTGDGELHGGDARTATSCPARRMSAASRWWRPGKLKEAVTRLDAEDSRFTSTRSATGAAASRSTPSRAARAANGDQGHRHHISHIQLIDTPMFRASRSSASSQITSRSGPTRTNTSPSSRFRSSAPNARPTCTRSTVSRRAARPSPSAATGRYRARIHSKRWRRQSRASERSGKRRTPSCRRRPSRWRRRSTPSRSTRLT